MSNKTIFVPKKIKVGFDNRGDTYNGKLAYVIYYDAKGNLRKEKSWDSWRDHEIEPQEFDNTPTEGFVLNKKVGGYSWSGWNPRQTYSRVYDPRGFEFEITIPNLLYILENANSIKGKGLEGKFVYAWDGTELLLIPEGAPEYANFVEYSTMLSGKSIQVKDLILGATYLTNKNEELVYLGKFDKWYSGYRSRYKSENKGKHHYFARVAHGYFEHMKSISGRILKVVDETPAANYAELVDKMEMTLEYSPYDISKDIHEPIPIQKILDKVENRRVYWNTVSNNHLIGITAESDCHKDQKGWLVDRVNAINDYYDECQSTVILKGVMAARNHWYEYRGYRYGDKISYPAGVPLEELLTTYPPVKTRKFNANGKEIK